MVDKLTKKRIKVDYELIIRVLGLDIDFNEYCWKKSNNISMRRKALAFLRGRKVDIERVYYDCKEHGLETYEDYVNYNVDIAKFNVWENE